MIVYLLLNTVNNKSYVGQHLGDKISTRWPSNLKGGNPHLESARKKYGPKAFSKEILNYCCSQEEMNNLERLWILTLCTYDPNYGYNLTFGGEGGKRTDEAKKNNSKAHVGIKYMNRNKPSFSTRTFWPKFSDERKKKHSDILKKVCVGKNMARTNWTPEKRKQLANSVSKLCRTKRENGIKRYSKPVSESSRMKNSIRVSNLVWITNGLQNKRINKELEIPSGFIRGKVKKQIQEIKAA